MSPSGFRAKYMSSTSYSCTTATRAPLRYQYVVMNPHLGASAPLIIVIMIGGSTIPGVLSHHHESDR